MKRARGRKVRARSAATTSSTKLFETAVACPNASGRDLCNVQLFARNRGMRWPNATVFGLIVKCWREINPEVLKNLVADMNERMKLVLAHRFQQSRRREAPSTAELTQVSLCELTASHLHLDTPRLFQRAVADAVAADRVRTF